jgi:hypothetical protein
LTNIINYTVNHLLEWGNSCVDDQLIRLNVTSLTGQDPYDYLLYSDTISRCNNGRVKNHILKRYQHVEQGGWWCSGIDLLTGRDDLWGCFKPSQPRYNLSKRRPIKYEHPPKTPTSLFALRLPQLIWQRIATRYQLEVLPCDIDPKKPDLGFWQWLIAHPSVPLCITEGAKKAGALLTAGYAAIALPGVFGGYRVKRDENGNRIGKSRLIPQLLKLATHNRPIYLAFDQDSKPTTIKTVNAAIRQLGYLLKRQGCSVKVITWASELGKGVDDLIATHSQEAFDQAYQRAVPLDTWKAQTLNALTHTPAIQVNCRYLPDLPIPDEAKLIAIKSPKGTGKTHFLEGVVKQAIARQQWVLVIGHRVRLVEALCQRFGLNYITEVRDRKQDAVLGYGLCIDSLHPASQASFNAANWSDGVVIIDEVEQVLWHGLDSTTCSSHRVAILKSLKTLIQNVLGGEGQVFVADADLSDVSIDYLVSLSGVETYGDTSLKPFIIQNDWKPEADEAWQVHHYSDSTPQRLVQDLESHIREGGKPFVCLSAQKRGSQWSTCTLEAYLQQQFPQAKILRIDSESLAEPTHPAYGCMTHLDRVLGDYDIVLASPAIETGVSIELKGHFTSVWGIAQGVQSENSVRQALGRVRENLPRYLWVASYGFNQVGNGSTSIPALLTSFESLTQANIRLLQQADFEALDDIETGFQAESMLCWAKMAVRLNTSMQTYRESVLAALVAEGHQVRDVTTPQFAIKVPATELAETAIATINAPNAAANSRDSSPNSKTRPHNGIRGRQNSKSEEDSSQSETNSLMAAIAAVKNKNYQAECEAIANSKELSDSEYQVLQKRLVKTLSQRRTLRKYSLKRRYGIPVTAQLVTQDDQGWYPKLLLHYYLTIGRDYLAQRDATVARELIESGNGSIFLPDFNRSQLGAAIGTMDILGMPTLLQSGERELRNTDEDLREMAALALSNRAPIKTALGIKLAANATPITIVRRLLDKIGYSLKCLRRESLTGKRVRVYQAVTPQDGRIEVFQYWLASESQRWDTSSSGLEESASYFNSQIVSANSDESKYIQLSLDF